MSFFFSIPSVVLKILLGGMSQLLLIRQNISAQKAIGPGYKFVYPKLQNARKRLLSTHYS
jgi:NAD dependent epimerase/dehydratase family enzyme